LAQERALSPEAVSGCSCRVESEGVDSFRTGLLLGLGVSCIGNFRLLHFDGFNLSSLINEFVDKNLLKPISTTNIAENSLANKVTQCSLLPKTENLKEAHGPIPSSEATRNLEAKS
jgi:hypothetical protein